MDIAQVLAVLRPGEDWGPCAQSESTYADLARTWRSSESACPTEAEMLACWAELEATRTQREQQRLNQQALATIFGGTDPLHVALKRIFSDLYTQINDVREHDFRNGPLERILEPAIMARLVAALDG